MANQQDGAHVPLSVNTAKALADLREVARQADAAQAKLRGLPDPGSGSPGLHPRLPPMPQAGIPGGRGGSSMRKANARAVESLRGMRREQEVLAGTRPVHIPAGPSAAAESRAQAGKFLLTPDASGAAEQGAWAQTKQRLARSMSFSEGLKTEADGLSYGPLKMGRDGLALRNVWTKLGPAMAYGAVVVGGLKMVEAGGVFLLNAIEESSRSGRPIRETLSMALQQGVDRAVANATESLYSATIGMGMNVNAGLAAGAMLLVDRPDLAKQVQFAWTTARREAADFFAEMRGEKTSAQKLVSLRNEREIVIDTAIAESKRQAEKDAERVAEQLMRLGFPGSMDRLKGEVQGTIWEASQRPKLDKLIHDYDRQESALINGDQGG